jgi:SWIM zinc finger
MSRKDLLALTPEALASLSTLGDVKRAQREISEGIGPTLDEQADGTVVGTFPDGIVTRLIAGKTLRDSPSTCKCASGQKCRHRVAVALAYKPWHTAKLDGSPPPSSARIPTNWSPAEIDDAALEKAVGAKRIERARVALRGGVLVTVERDGVPTAKLPACTVRFLVPRDAAYARCDCRDAQQGCEHVVIGVWAFREAASHEGASVVVSLGGSAKKDDSKPLDAALDLAATLLRSGVTHAPPHLQSRFAAVRTELDKHGFVWPLNAIEDLERSLEAYAARSSLYSSREVAALLCELEARARASHHPAELPVRFVLGQDEASVTPLDHVRLVSLGARLQADGRVRFAQVYLADPDTAMVLMLRKRWDFKDGEEPEDGPALARRSVASRVTLGALAAGQVVSKVVKRKANRELELGTSRTAMTSVTPQRGDWESLPSPILVKNLEEHEAWLKTRPPRALRPRLLAENVHVIAVSAVEDVVYLPAEQQIIAKLLDASQHPFFLRITHRRVAPHAIDAAATALTKKVRFVAGELWRGPLGFEMNPLAIAEDVMTVPDIATQPPTTVNIPHASHRHGEDPVAAAVEAAESALDEIAHVGLDAVPHQLVQRCEEAAERLDDAGIESLGTRMRTLEKAIKERSANAPHAWFDACVRTAVVRETL